MRKQLATFNIEGKDFTIVATHHAVERMEQRGVSTYAVSGDIMALGPDTLERLRVQKENAMIIDEDKNISIVIDFADPEIKVVTVIDKSNVFVKKGTTVEKLA